MISPMALITLPDVVMLSGSETIHGRIHEAVRSIVWFSTEQERDRCLDVGATFEYERYGRKFFGGEVIYYLD